MKYEPTRFLRFGDVLWNSTGTGTIGRACVVPQELELEGMVADSHVTVLRPLLIDSAFLCRWIQSPQVQDEIENFASGTTNQIELNTSTVINLLMPLPPLEEQRRIAARIEQMMTRCDAIEKLRAARDSKRLSAHAAAMECLLSSVEGEEHRTWHFLNRNFRELYSAKENISELRQVAQQLAVIGKLKSQESSDAPAFDLLKEIEVEKLRLAKKKSGAPLRSTVNTCPVAPPFSLPEKWEWVRLGDIAIASDSGWSPQCKPEPRVGGDWGVLKVSAVSWGRFDPSENKALPGNLEPRKECEVRPGDFLISRANTDDLVARSVIAVEAPKHLMMSDKIVRFSLSSHVNKQFVNLVNGSRLSRSYYISNASGTSSSMKNVSRQVMENLPVPLPPLAEQHRIVAKLERLNALCDTLEMHIDAINLKRTELLNAVTARL